LPAARVHKKREKRRIAAEKAGLSAARGSFSGGFLVTLPRKCRFAAFFRPFPLQFDA
jgi:hypothetical protein